MSLILDALKRAEQERKLGQPPEAVQVTTMSPMNTASKSHDRTLIIVMALLLLGAAMIIAALLLRSHSAPASEPTQPPPTAALRPIPTPPPAAPHPASTPAPTAIADRDSVNSLDDVVAADDGKAENAQAAQVAEGKMPADATASRAAPAHVVTSARRSQTSANPRVTVTSDTPGAVVEQSAPADANQDSAATTAPQAPSLRQMPEAYREAFPQLTIDVHVYNDDPEHRFIIVGGNTYHEGNSLPQGPQIVAITSDGVVFEWQGQRVLYALGSN